MKDFLVSSSCLSKAELTGYLDGTLGEEVRYRVENHLLDCELCNAAVEGIAQTQSSTTMLANLADIEARIAKHPLAKPPAPLKAKRPKYALMGWAAVFLLLGLTGIALLRYHRHSLSDQLYEAHFSASPVHAYTITRSESDAAEGSYPAELAQGLSNYNAGQYDKSLIEFLGYLKEHQQEEQPRLMAALSAMCLGELAIADTLLMPLANSLNKPLAVEAQWYLGLSALSQRKTDQARLWLSAPAQDPSSTYHNKARLLLKQLPK